MMPQRCVLYSMRKKLGMLRLIFILKAQKIGNPNKLCNWNITIMVQKLWFKEMGIILMGLIGLTSRIDFLTKESFFKRCLIIFVFLQFFIENLLQFYALDLMHLIFLTNSRTSQGKIRELGLNMLPRAIGLVV